MRTSPRLLRPEIPTRATPMAFALAAALAACGGTPIEGAEATTTGTTTSSSSTTTGAGGAAPSSCTFSVSGAISEAAVIAEPVFEGAPGDGAVLDCGGLGGPESNSLWIGIDQLDGPGVYTTPAVGHALHAYQRSSSCPSGTCDPDTFGDEPDSQGCTVVLTDAPTGYVYGAPVKGTFSCAELVDDADPSRQVAISGTFATVLSPPPM